MKAIFNKHHYAVTNPDRYAGELWHKLMTAMGVKGSTQDFVDRSLDEGMYVDFVRLVPESLFSKISFACKEHGIINADHCCAVCNWVSSRKIVADHGRIGEHTFSEKPINQELFRCGLEKRHDETDKDFIKRVKELNNVNERDL